MNPSQAEAQRLAGRIAAEVTAWRLARGLTQADLAARVGTQQSAISRLEGGRHLPSLTLLHKVAQALDTRLEVFFRLEPVTRPTDRPAGG